MASTITRVRYAGLDFNTHEDELLARLQVKFASVYNDFAASSLGIMLVDIFSFGLDTLSFYLDRRATDNFLTTSRTLSSAARAARQLGYKPGTASASSVDMEVSLGEAYSFTVTLPAGFQFLGPNGLIFEAQESATWLAGDTSTKTVLASEGQTLTAVFFSNGEANQSFDVSNVPASKFIVGPGTENVSQVTVTVGGDAWEENEFLQFGATNQFEMGYSDSPPTVSFGDGIAGNIPESGTEISVTYFASSGVLGTATAGTITSAVSQLVVGFDVIDLVINNPQGASGGADPETINSIKANAPGFFRSRGVNVTLDDYKARAQSFVDPVLGSIAVARAINVRGSSDDAFLNSNIATIQALSSSFVTASDAGVAGVEVALDSIDASVAAAIVDDTALATDLVTIADEEVTVRASSEDIRTAANIISVNSTGVSSSLSSLTSVVSGYPVAGTTQITSADLNTLLNAINRATAQNNEISTQAATISSEVTTITSSLDEIDANADSAETRRAGIRVDIDSISANSTIARTAVVTLGSDISSIDNSISTNLSEIDEHVDGFLSSECQANLIEVPVLALDSEGFYVVPSNGLQRSLQRYLDAAKEVTQVVRVVGASNLLVAADITVTVGVLTGYNEASLRSQVEAEILGVLRGRRFDADLRLSDLYAPIAPEPDRITIEGVEWVIIKIVGPSDRIDSDGNLPVSQYEVVTRGTITVTSTVVTESNFN